ISQAGWFSSAAASADQWLSPRTRPVGMDGPIISTAAVAGPTAAASRSGSTVQPPPDVPAPPDGPPPPGAPPLPDTPPPGTAVAGTKRGTPPASRTRLTRPA